MVTGRTNLIGALVVSLALLGCANVTDTYGPEGRAAYSLNCSGTARNWGMCFEAAGEKCGTRGYNILNATTDNGTLVTANQQTLLATNTISRTMLVSCR